MELSYSKCYGSIFNWTIDFVNHVNQRSQIQLTSTIKSLIISLFLASFFLCHFCTFMWVLIIFTVNILNPCFFSLIYLSFLVSYSSCSHFSCALQHQQVRSIFAETVSSSSFMLVVPIFSIFYSHYYSYMSFSRFWFSHFFSPCATLAGERSHLNCIFVFYVWVPIFLPYKLAILISFLYSCICATSAGERAHLNCIFVFHVLSPYSFCLVILYSCIFFSHFFLPCATSACERAHQVVSCWHALPASWGAGGFFLSLTFLIFFSTFIATSKTNSQKVTAFTKKSTTFIFSFHPLWL